MQKTPEVADLDIDRDLVTTLDCRHGKVTFPRQDNTIGRSLSTYGEWAEAEVRLLLSIIEAGDVVVDVGANIGTHTLAFSRGVGPSGAVYSVEPHPVLHALLAENVRQNHLTNVMLVQSALSDMPGESCLPDIDLTTDGNFGRVAMLAETELAAGNALLVPVTTLDVLVPDGCDLVKIDVEGAELRVLRGAERTMSLFRPVVSAECLTLESGWGLLQLLHEFDYETWLHQARADNPSNWFGAKERIFGLACESNLLAVPKGSEKRARLPLSDPSLVPVSCLDDLARAMLDTPRWGSEQLESLSRPGLLAGITRLQEDKYRLEGQVTRVTTELAQVLTGEENLRRVVKQVRGQAASLQRETDEFRSELEATRTQLEATRTVVGQLSADLSTLATTYTSSTSWRITAPLRALGHQARSLTSTGRPRGLRKRLRNYVDAWRLFGVNGVSPSTRAHRLARTWDLVRFLRTSSPTSDPNWLFSTRYYLSTYPDVRNSNINPLWHFVTQGASEGRQPHPLFDTAYYVGRNPDVKSSGMNPLLHFLTHGSSEGRDPSPWFSSSFYRTQLPVGTPGLSDGRLLAHYMQIGFRDGLDPHPSFSTSAYVADHPDAVSTGVDPLSHFVLAGALRQTDTLPPVSGGPLDDSRDVIDRWDRRRFDGRPVVLFVTHGHGGGTDHHVRELITMVGHRVHAIVLTPMGPIGSLVTASHARLSVPDEDQQAGIVFDLACDVPALVLALRAVGVERVHVHHRMGLDDVLDPLLSDLSLPYDVTLHDFYALAPSPHLLGASGTYIEPDESASGELTAGCAVRSLEAWRSMTMPMLHGAERVIVPSLDTAARVMRYFPELTIVAAAHPQEPRLGLAPQPGVLSNHERVRVVVLGTLVAHKGRTIVEECADIAAARQLPIEFHILGDVPGGLETFNGAGMHQHGPYTVEALPSLLRDIGPHVAWFPSQVPETFSYTLSEAMGARLPVVASAIGSLPERLGGRPWTWLSAWDSSPVVWTRLLMGVRDALLTRQAPVPPPVVPAAVHDFYPDQYLRPLADRESLAC